MRVLLACLVGASLAACSSPVPNSGAGVGFGTAEEFRAAQAAREAQLLGTPLPDQTAEAVDAVVPGPDTEAAEDLQAAAPAPVQAQPIQTQAAAQSPVAQPAPPQPEPVATAQASTARAAAPAQAPAARTGDISDEQNFDAVAGRESIESDAARIAANRQQYVVIQPTALPSRSGAGPNIVAYAIATNNPVGVQLYRRNALTSQNRFLRNCASYASADLAQQAFLANGGPERDRRGLDPDGDGFACAWDPTPFRVVGN